MQQILVHEDRYVVSLFLGELAVIFCFPLNKPWTEVQDRKPHLQLTHFSNFNLLYLLYQSIINFSELQQKCCRLAKLHTHKNFL
ncbi:unknown protein [Desulfotalea psychrophila LSv54]|uniref:Uncharacterized protein n=1 Tax=Desulfotalea psychrophila (strain LSv54 / DSM 12343) TaxID=177439 RepID=Q6AR90_DESPS|nr:unknown protein [Desulfotalea psychrophila LSv54]